MVLKWVCGMFVCVYQLLIMVGLFVVVGVNILIYNMKGVVVYCIFIGFQFIWVVVLVFGLLILLEMFCYFIKCGYKDVVVFLFSCLCWFDIIYFVFIEEFVEIQVNYEYELVFGFDIYKDIFFGELYLGCCILIGCGL